MTSQVFPSSIITEFYNGSSWVNISQYVVSEISGEGGFQSPNPSEFTAGLGNSEFDLDNSGGLFTVYGGDSVRGLNTLTGWRKGAKIRHRVVYDGYDKAVWLGFIGDVKSDDGTWGDERAHVTCVDWIDAAARYPMKRSQILTNQTLADGVQSIADRVSVAPEDVDSDPSSTTFSAIFDNVRGKTKALAEIDKLARSEMGFVYVLKDGVLKVEGAGSRRGTDALTQVPVGSGNALLVSADNALLVSTDNALLVSEIEDANLSLDAEKLDLVMADDYWNDAYVRDYPTKTDTSLVVVYSLGSPILISAGQTIEWIGNYTDPNGGNPINATNQQTPVATTDYLFNTASDGSGTNVTASGTVVADYYGDVVVYRLTNGYSTPAYITRLQARGFGIYRTSYQESHISATGSMTTYGEKTFDLNQTYQSNSYAGLAYGKSVLELYNTPKTRIISARYNANLNSSHMLAFMYLDIGSLIRVYDGRSGMYKWFHIMSRKFTIFLGGVIIVTFGLAEFVSVNSGGLNPVVLEYPKNSTANVNFGHLPDVYSDTTPETISFSIWFYLRDLTDPNVTNAQDLMMFNIHPGGLGFYIRGMTTTPQVFVYSNVFNTSTGHWIATFSPTSVIWHNAVMTFDISSTANDPVVYYDGTRLTVTESVTPSGSKYPKNGIPLIIGNRMATPNLGASFNGRLFDARVYHKILTQTEVTAIYNGGTPSMSAGSQDMVLQAPAINSDLGTASSLDGQQIPAGNNYFDNILRYIGVPQGALLIRSLP